MSATLARGFTFTHDRHLDPDWRPDVAAGERYADGPKARMRVTRVTATSGYFVYLDGKGRTVCDRADFERRFCQ